MRYFLITFSLFLVWSLVPLPVQAQDEPNCFCLAPQSIGSVTCTGGSNTVLTEEDCEAYCGGSDLTTLEPLPGADQCVERFEPLPEEVTPLPGPIVGFGNPLCPNPAQRCDVPTILGNIIRAALGIVGSIALLMFVYGGFIWMIGAQQGAEKKVRYAREILKWSAIGLFVIFASYMIVNFIIEKVTTVGFIPSAHAAGTNLENPLMINGVPVKDVPTLMGLIIKATLGLTGSVALLFFIYGGFLWLTAAGNPDKIKKGRGTLVWAAIGLAFIFLSYIIANFIIQALTGQL